MLARRIVFLVVAVAAIAAVALWLRDLEDPDRAAAADLAQAASTESAAEPASADARANSDATISDVTGEDGGRAASSPFDPPSVPSEPLTIRGRVVAEEGGAPIAGAEVAADRSFRGSVRTDAEGNYLLALATVEPRDLRVEARAPGFGRREAPVGEFLGHELTVDFELMQARRASGRLIDPAGAPVAGAVVSAHAAIEGSEGHMIDLVEKRSDAEGGFLLADLRPDLPHLLRIEKPGFATAVYCFPSDEKARVEVEFGAIALLPAIALDVTVVDDAGAPLAGVALSLTGGNADWMRFASSETLYTARDLWRRRGNSDAAGRCRFEQLAPASWQLRASLRGRPPVAPIELELLESEPAAKVTVTFPRGLAIAGRVVDRAGRPLRGADVYVAPAVEAPELMLWVVSDAAGAFRVDGLEPGDYRITHGINRWFAPFDPSEAQDTERTTTVAAGRVDVVLRIDPVEDDTIRGIVRDVDGRPVACAEVKILLATGGNLSTRTQVGGRFEVAIPRGTTVHLLAGPRDVWPRWTEGTGYDLTGTVAADGKSGEIALTWTDSLPRPDH